MRTSPLDDRHQQLGARMAPFAGWSMPIDYGSIIAEHTAVREGAGAFDLSHLGTIKVTGHDAEAAVQAAFTNDAAALAVGRASYALCLTEDAGILDDLLVYHLDWGWFVVPNAANAAAVQAAIEESAAGRDCVVRDVKAELACIAVQGPHSDEVVAAAGVDVADLDYLDCRGFPESDGVLARSGYTGERGYELFVPATQAGELWDRLLAEGVTPVGLGARDTLRLEMGYPLHGQDISPQTSPVDAGLRWAVKDVTEFRGRDAYLEAKANGPTRRLRGLRATGRGIPRAGSAVLLGDTRIGEVTSGTFSPTLKVGIAMAYLTPEVEEGAAVTIDVRGKAVDAEVVRPPFVAADPRA